MITVESLEAIGACEEGVEAFAEVYPDGLDPAAWTFEEQLRVLKHTELREYLGWAWRNKVVPQWSMIGVNLNGANLTRANLTGANLSGAIWDEREPPADWRVNMEGRLESQPLKEGEEE